MVGGLGDGSLCLSGNTHIVVGNTGASDGHTTRVDGDDFVRSRVRIRKGAGKSGDADAVAGDQALLRCHRCADCGSGGTVVGLFGHGNGGGDFLGADGEVLLYRQIGVVVGSRHGEASFVGACRGGGVFAVGGVRRRTLLVLHLHRIVAELGRIGGCFCVLAVGPADDGGLRGPLVGGLGDLEGGIAARFIPLIVVAVLQLELHGIAIGDHVHAAVVHSQGVQRILGKGHIRRLVFAGVDLAIHGGGGDGVLFNLKLRRGSAGELVVAVTDGGGDGVGARVGGGGGAVVVPRAVIGRAGVGQGHGNGVTCNQTVQLRRGGGNGAAVSAAVRGDGHGDGLGADGEVLHFRQTGVVAGFRHGEAGGVIPRVGGDGFAVGGVRRILDLILHLHGAELGTALGDACGFAVGPALDVGPRGPVVFSLGDLELYGFLGVLRISPLVVFGVQQFKNHIVVVRIDAAIVFDHGVLTRTGHIRILSTAVVDLALDGGRGDDCLRHIDGDGIGFQHITVTSEAAVELVTAHVQARYVDLRIRRAFNWQAISIPLVRNGRRAAGFHGQLFVRIAEGKADAHRLGFDLHRDGANQNVSLERHSIIAVGGIHPLAVTVISIPIRQQSEDYIAAGYPLDFLEAAAAEFGLCVINPQGMNSSAADVQSAATRLY